MWLSEQSAAIRRSVERPEVATVTIPGATPAARVGSERRGLTVLAPGGYVWVPGTDAEVMTLSCATGEIVVAGMRQGEVPAGLQPGEVYLHAGSGASVLLRNNGQVVIRGSVQLQGAVAVTGSLTLNGVPVQVETVELGE